MVIDHPHHSPRPPEAFLTTAEAAELYRLNPGYLRQLRVKGGGPRFTKLGRACRYRMADLLAWAQERTFASTSEAEAA